MNKKKELIPVLRFPNFKNEGEWSEKKIYELGETINGLTGKSGEDFGTGKSYVTYKQVFDSSTIDFQKCGKVRINGNENQNALQKGDILFTTSSETANEVGFASVLIDSPKEETYLNSFCFSLRPFSLKDTLPQFSRYLFHSPFYRKSITALAQGSTRYNISKGAFLNLKLPIPKRQEQQKIASCLSSLDEVIAAHSQKLDLLKDHKKGLMQNLFPQEGEKVPKYRFKEFAKDGEWVEKKLIDTTDTEVKWSFTGGPFGSNLKASDYTKKGIRIIQLQNIGDGEFNNDYKIYTSEEKADELLSCNIYSGEIILSKMGDPVGRACIIPNYLERCVMASDGIRVVVNEKKHSKYFIFSLLNSKRIRESIEKKATGSTRKRIGLDELKLVKLTMPQTLTEQQKIAGCFSALDKLIFAQAEKIDQLKLHKKGLMQGLFPKMND
ncbi:MAG: restriction endonuclease subunit S [Chitinophagaceae bacterium]|nr:restriction endonuclease subunit S [Chitinophagaceae bacterium]MCW5925950.1 restriction endonuclease subunit S [Chitinophagaceae bacterium]